jgi:hypothetical protein
MNIAVPEKSAGCMQPFVNEIQTALGAGAYYAALMMTLGLPGICASLEMENGWSARDEYIDWYERYLAKAFPAMDAQECYSMRCGVVHMGQGGLATKSKQKDRVVFMLPNPESVVLHNGVSNNILFLHAVKFCEQVMDAVKEWADDTANHKHVNANKSKLLTYRPNGLPPLIKGLPLIS